MRISTLQQTVIKDSIHKAFGSDARVYLFGSRVRDDLKGGDIDLLVSSCLSGDEARKSKIKAIVSMIRSFGDRKIDLITTSSGDSRDERVIVREALQKGVEL